MLAKKKEEGNYFSLYNKYIIQYKCAVIAPILLRIRTKFHYFIKFDIIISYYDFEILSFGVASVL